MTIQIYGIVPISIVDGPGWRCAIFVQGCPHKCPGCHNPGSHDPTGGELLPIEELEKLIDLNKRHLSGITLSGGEPFEQAGACAHLAQYAHANGLTVWTYSGYTYEQLEEKANRMPEVAALLQETDVLVDGPFILAQRSLELQFRGSKNQRIIDMNKTRQRGSVILWTPPAW